ncbi:conserved hypothetical protein [Culex quinquefasciatus]|uniref:Uncharacterized protein n=1 Tax=Culex quinquefasciatus TaxID=7176 RepID=B0X3W9_CULQU|nr:conserved hypothetical protein [Culex quinquefasciatus]|eukprot:XP_001864341.1 conserved hypothetical protein [Culex quinquefasciatus]
MLFQVVNFLGLVAISLAYRQYAYSTEVKHIIPIKQDLIESPQDIPTIVVLGEGEESSEKQQEPEQQLQEPIEQEPEQAIEQQQNTLESEPEVDLDSHYFSHYPNYKYEYGVKDYLTGDQKSQWETREGDVVRGEYTLLQPDGTHRVVRYTADDKNGFEAEVKNVDKANELSDGAGEIDVRSLQTTAEEEGSQGEELSSGKSDGQIAYSYNKLRQYL